MITWDVTDKGVTSELGLSDQAEGKLFFGGACSGTWAMSTNLSDEWSETFLECHLGNTGNDELDSYLAELDPGNRQSATSGTWKSLLGLPGSKPSVLSNICPFGVGPRAKGNWGRIVSEPATLALVGLGLLGGAAARRKRRVLADCSGLSDRHQKRGSSRISVGPNTGRPEVELAAEEQDSDSIIGK